jgi:hypothetical protein
MKEIIQSNFKQSTAVLVFLFLLIATAPEAKENYSIPPKAYPQVLTMSEHMERIKTLNLSDKDKARWQSIRWPDVQP